MATPDTPFLDFAAKVRQCVDVPVIAVGRLGRPAQAIDAVEKGLADFIALGRPLLADAGWVRKAAGGKPVRLCLACNTCVDGMREGTRLHCLVNPVTGRERDLANRLPRFQGQRIAVLGAGPAGLTFAASVASHNTVTVFERNSVAGGALRVAGFAPKFQNVEASQQSLLRYIDSLVRECEELGVEIEFGWNLRQGAAVLKDFDHIVIATGATYRGGTAYVVTRLLAAGFFRAPVFRRAATHAGVRKWFYEKARKPTRGAIERWLPQGVPVTVIGDARVAGKSDAAIRDALFSAYGLAPS